MDCPSVFFDISRLKSQEMKPPENQSGKQLSSTQATHTTQEAARQQIEAMRQHFCRLEIKPHSSKNGNIHQQAIGQEINWWLQTLWCRLINFDSKAGFQAFLGTPDYSQRNIEVPALPPQSHYGKWVHQHALQPADRLLLATVMVSSLNDALFFGFHQLLRVPLISSFVGGQTSNEGRRFFPSIQTLLYLLGGTDMQKHTPYQLYFFQKQAKLQQYGVQLRSSVAVRTGLDDIISPNWKNLLLSLDSNIWEYFLGNEMPRPEHNQELPLTRLETSLTFEDLILPEATKEELQPILDFAEHGQEFFKDAKASAGFKRGFISLLHGEPGTGKTMIATTIGKKMGLVTYQLELAQVVSKYIGETSKNINKVFEELERTIEHLKGEPSILFIDEADSLVGKRSEVKDSKDRYANMDVSNLLQKLETFQGIVIMASNYQQNFDPAIKRRIGDAILIPPPGADERTQLWKNYCPKHLRYPTENFARTLGEKFGFTGAQINNVMKTVAFTTYKKGIEVLDFDEHLEPPIRKEFMKNNEVYSRPRDLMSAAQVDAEHYAQQLLWEKALPSGWQYNPTYLPRIISQTVVLTQDEIKGLVKKVKQRWEGGAYKHIPFNEGIEVVLRDLCGGKGLNWNGIQAHIYRLFDEETGKTDELPDTAEEKSGKTVQLVDLSKLKDFGKDKTNDEPATDKGAAQKKEQAEPIKKLSKLEVLQQIAAPPARRGKIMKPAEAEKFWMDIVPDGYHYASKGTAKNLAKMYGVCKDSALWIIKRSVEEADKEEEKELLGSKYVTPAIDALAELLGLESLMRQKFIDEEKKRIADFEKKKKKVPNWKDAPRYWAEAPPQGYRYARGDMAKHMAQFCPDWSFGQMLVLLAKAAEFADKDQTTAIAYTEHMLLAFQALGLQPPM